MDHMGNHNAAVQQFMEGRAPSPEWCRCTPDNLFLIGCDCDREAYIERLRKDAKLLDTGMDPDLVRELHATIARLEGESQ